MEVKRGDLVFCNHFGGDLLYPVDILGRVLSVNGGFCIVDHQGKNHRTSLHNVSLVVTPAVIDMMDVVGYNLDMAANPQFSIRFPEPYMQKIKAWADLCGIAVGTLIFQAVLEGMPEVLAKYGVDYKQNDIGNNDKRHTTM